MSHKRCNFCGLLVLTEQTQWEETKYLCQCAQKIREDEETEMVEEEWYDA